MEEGEHSILTFWWFGYHSCLDAGTVNKIRNLQKYFSVNKACCRKHINFLPQGLYLWKAKAKYKVLYYETFKNYVYQYKEVFNSWKFYIFFSIVRLTKFWEILIYKIAIQMLVFSRRVWKKMDSVVEKILQFFFKFIAVIQKNEPNLTKNCAANSGLLANIHT